MATATTGSSSGGSAAASTPSPKVQVTTLPRHGGRALVTIDKVSEGDVLLVERPIAAAQFAWNEACKYTACGYCMRSLETAAGMFARLAELSTLPTLPHPECCQASPDETVPCTKGCESVYCTAYCRAAAWEDHHGHLCSKGPQGALVSKLREAWKAFHPPPETTSIELLCRIVTLVVTKSASSAVLVDAAADAEAGGEEGEARNVFAGTPFAHFCSEVELPGGFRHKTLDIDWSTSVDHIRLLMLELFTSLFPGSTAVPAVLSQAGFRSILAMVGRNGAGVGTSAIAAYDAKVTVVDMSEIDRLKLDTLLNGLYEAMDEATGEFLDCEGSGLYAVQSACNHSCAPNAEYCFPANSAELHLTAVSDIAAGDEVTISYLDPCAMRQCRNYRHEELAESYLFSCDCPKCIAQVDCPDQSDEDDDDDDDEEEEEDTRCIPCD